MSITRIFEAQRVYVGGASEAVIPFVKTHDFPPVVTILLEPDTNTGLVNNYIMAPDEYQIAVQFGAEFTGYVHIQAASDGAV
tara:strand:+ start:882 stop:1127 length:246 start_codon:yes stop_codon:yes gene_type:complete